MAVKIRLRRTGARNRPSYRFVVADSRERRDGAFVELIGHYDPLTEPATVSVNVESLSKWLNEGAQMSETVRSLLKKQGVLDRSGKPKPQGGEGEAGGGVPSSGPSASSAGV